MKKQKLKGCAISILIFILSLVAIGFPALILHKIGLDITDDAEINQYVLMYSAMLFALAGIPIALVIYTYGEFEPSEALGNGGGSSSELDLPIMIGGVFLLVGKWVSRKLLGKDYEANAKGNILLSLLSGYLISFVSIAILLICFITIAALLLIYNK